MEFSPEKIKKVAKLAKVKLTEDEIVMFNDQFMAISEIITKIQKVDTKGVIPVHNPSHASTLLRKDEVTDGGYVDDILVNAPKQAFGCFVVPKVVE
ncbi:MAG: Asp-tRNA(Asn)/Glu-tRNA(Gln) amidotransferase subunit GatC [Rickettsiales bacterium]|jgi:aspartyl-tRNA(Asn)/glutamyl-tRNA(Gln) amidotransferase subunit C|nr:Asp-tRNA(Asn)/Glu-tRNA(Gln) amidotransferase subunit GatC [Rickettsiales bacterium]